MCRLQEIALQLFAHLSPNLLRPRAGCLADEFAFDDGGRPRFGRIQIYRPVWAPLKISRQPQMWFCEAKILEDESLKILSVIAAPPPTIFKSRVELDHL